MVGNIYLRKSRMEEDCDTAETLARHKKTLLAFADEHELSIVEIYEEVVSGETLYSRPEMLRLLEDLDLQHFDFLLCMDIDRLGRSSMAEQGIVLETLKRNGTRIITPRKQYDLNNDMDETYSEFESFMARQELKIIKRRLRSGIRRTVNDGGYIANAPYGYVKIKKNKTPTLEVFEPEAIFIRMIFDMYVHRGMGGQAIADAISALGAKPHRSERFGRTSVVAILRNPVYIGVVTWDKKKHIRKGTHNNSKHITIYNKPEDWTVVDGLHPAIVERELFEAAQNILREKYHPHTSAPANAMAGLIRCANCGALMQRQHIHQNGRHEWEAVLCLKPRCIQSVQYAYLEDAVLEYLRQSLSQLTVELRREDTSPATALFLQSAHVATQKEIAAVQQQLDSLHNFLERGVYDIKTFLARSRVLNERFSALQEQAAAQTAAIAKARGNDRRELRNRVANVLDVYTDADVQTKNMLLKSVIESVTYDRAPKSKPRDFMLSVQLREVDGVCLEEGQSLDEQES